MMAVAYSRSSVLSRARRPAIASGGEYFSTKALNCGMPWTYMLSRIA